MTDKQIIIDGIDVSEWTDEEVKYKFAKHSPKAIKTIAFDLYKQLERKEQECETLASQLDFEAQKKECLEQECERLKHDNGYEVGALEKTIDNLKAENDLLRKTHKTEQDRRRAYENALTEIKEIAEKDFRHTAWEEYAKQLKQILQKISECEVGND